MSCWHGCGPCHVVYRHGRWAEPYWDPYDEDELVVLPRGRRRGSGRDREGIQSLEARLEDLRVELEQVQAALAALKTDERAESAE